jgi:predicted MFS family arabinose efflux permease
MHCLTAHIIPRGVSFQIDRILPFIMARPIKEGLSLSGTQAGLLTEIAYAGMLCGLFIATRSCIRPRFAAVRRGSPRFVLCGLRAGLECDDRLGAFAERFLLLALTRFGVALGHVPLTG